MSKTTHHADDLIRLFNETFEESHNTVLIGGGAEPEYRPADELHPRHRIIFTRDYFASALHEVAHWCIAGAHRRKLVDYGYWYEPDGRGPERQAEFERVEARPQAIEWAFSIACGSPFRVSLDNLDGPQTASEAFQARVREARTTMEAVGFPPRAKTFIRVLRDWYQGS
ncbi:elongation factor P hydroxylase [Gammaproteobacteria bacterium AB-CW1]|uniref:Elongation factor P hydroxylase n=1 Tax=Natronospira elongata TaxID=3110268 RepID=A0AAP6MM32_9GAMM|nr:elongation factor P hydroxylase [Gammaproteobacteria bacterium AB-CW1]